MESAFEKWAYEVWQCLPASEGTGYYEARQAWDAALEEAIKVARDAETFGDAIRAIAELKEQK